MNRNILTEGFCSESQKKKIKVQEYEDVKKVKLNERSIWSDGMSNYQEK